LGKDNQTILVSQYTLTWGLPSIKIAVKYLSLFWKYYKLKFLGFFTHITVPLSNDLLENKSMMLPSNLTL